MQPEEKSRGMWRGDSKTPRHVERGFQ